jgi:hypothetical protein
MHSYEDSKKLKMVAFCLIFAASLVLSLYYGFQKSGFHEDEYYTYYSSNRTYGLFQPDREWQDRQTILDEFVVRKGEGFNYGLVKLVQSWDVHPPLYYWIFHTICSFVPGIFTKWAGILTNLIGFVIAYFFFCLLLEEMCTPLWVEILTLLFWGMNPQTVSCNMLIRMYAWLTAAILVCAYFHVRLIREYDNNSLEIRTFVTRSLVPVAVTAFLGFMIQYFFIFFFFIIGFEMAFYIAFIRKDLRNALLYVASCGLGLGLAVIVYPAGLHHMFGGYRGGDASGSFFDFGNTWMRLSFFTGLLNDFVFAKGLVVLVLVIFLGVMMKMADKRRAAAAKKNPSRPDPKIVILTVASIGYFLMTSKTALLVGAASNRYEMPIYGLLIYLVLLDIYHVVKGFKGEALLYAVAAVVVMLLIKGHVYDRNVLFLYPEDREKIAFAAENAYGSMGTDAGGEMSVGTGSEPDEDVGAGVDAAEELSDDNGTDSEADEDAGAGVDAAGELSDDNGTDDDTGEDVIDDSDECTVCIVMFNPATPQNVWRLTDELLMYPKVYYMDEENLSPIVDAEVVSADRIILYAADDDVQDKAFTNLLSSTGLSVMNRVFEEDMWTTYEVE